MENKQNWRSRSTSRGNGQHPFGSNSRGNQNQNTNRFRSRSNHPHSHDDSHQSYSNNRRSNAQNENSNRHRTRSNQPHVSNDDDPNQPNSNTRRNNFHPNPNQTQANDTAKKARFYRMGFQKLEEFTTTDPDELVVKLSGDSKVFSNLLDEKLSNDYIVLIIRVVVQMCRSVFDANKAPLLAIACKDNFIEQLKYFILTLPVQSEYEKNRSKYYWNNEADFWINMCTYCNIILSTIPTTACDLLERLLMAIIYTLPNLRMSDDVKSDFEELQVKLLLHKTEIERKKTNPTENQELEEPEPVDSFRNVSLYPTSEEITTTEKAFLRKNIVSGAYKNIEHYIDVQFRLLREDFVAPLRTGICQFLGPDDGRKKLQNIKIHRKVQFLRPELVNGNRGVLVQFQWSTKKLKFKYENSRKFMFGSLVCFTKDNFQTLLFGKIIDRKIERLQNGLLIVGFEPGMDTYELNVDYMMVECKVFFEPYYHVLRALQSITDANFPMKEYLVDVTPRAEIPEYIQMNSGRFAVDTYSVDLALDNWPDSERLKLNAAQYIAYKNALTQKFAIIQGPPGTGKTYLGLRIAKTLIQNKLLWKNEGPMLVVCYTNHALDQFLEGLIGTTDLIIRIGGQSKNEKIAPFNIKQMRAKVVNKSVGHALWMKRKDLECEVQKIKNAHADLDSIYNYEGVIDFSCFLHLCPELQGTWFEQTDKSNIAKWLLGGITVEERHQERLQHEFQQMQQNVQNTYSDNESEEEEFFDAVNRPENQLDIDDDFDMLATPNVKYIIRMSDLADNIKALDCEINSITIKSDVEMIARAQLVEQIQKLQDDFKYLQMRLNQGRATSTHVKPTQINLHQPEDILPHVRWQLYFYWLDQYKNAITEKLRTLEIQYRNVFREYEEIRTIEDCQIMKSCLVLGMTTTSAARLQTTLQALKCPIVIVEEAAEILEAHIVTSLTKNCQHLILIGDHKQLRPSTADYNIEKNFLLGISLFERMIKNSVHCNLLDVQHRMRPEFAKLIVPAVYPRLENHQSVNNFPPIKGVDDCLYFITHQHEEEVSGDESKSNMHEAKFLLKLARYLILNGYEPEDVTILAAYSGQMFALFRERKRMEVLKDVRITVLDNYQGEESKIILLSLVRNNTDNSIGFLKIENRVCVALSRAKEGFYMMGNINLLASNSKIWPKVKESLSAQNALGTSLALRCQIHPSIVTHVKTADDFCKVSEGGCSQICRQTLICGHTCVMQCHIRNREHNEYKCKEKCTRSICKRDHPCPQLCYETCRPCIFPMSTLLSCGHIQDVPCHVKQEDYNCPVPVTTELPCKHKTDKPCYRDAETFPCPFPCDTRIETCGHACRLSCHIRNDPDHLQYKCLKPCAKNRAGCSQEHPCNLLCCDDCPPCLIVVPKIRTVCSHIHKVPCNEEVDTLICERPCKKILPCGHKCTLLCCETCGKCSNKVVKIVPECNHKIKIECSVEPTRAVCVGKCPRLLPCGHQCMEKCKDECTKKCMVLIDNPHKAECGHIFKTPCYLRNEDLESNAWQLLKHCREPCSENLECNHKCPGTCGECYQGRIHKSCAEKCGKILVCGHECLIPCRETCQPCNLPCNYACVHSKCKKKCGEPCTPCKEKCPRRCPHAACSAKCSDICSVPPCDKPCRKKLKCGHDCVGFCNEPCPPLCRFCNQFELMEEFVLGYEDEEDARFVLLEECGHVIESNGMDQWLQSGGNQINAKRCPRCNTVLTTTKRYSNYIKESIANITKVKRKCYGSEKENEEMRIELQQRLDTACESTRLSLMSKTCVRVKETLQKSLQPIRNDRKQKIHTVLAKTLTSKIQIYQQICKLFDCSKVTGKSPKCMNYINFLLKVLMKQEDRITNQEIQDFEREVKRLRRMLQLAQIEERTYVATSTSPRIKELYNTLAHKLYSSQKYDSAEDDKIKERLTELAKKTSSGLDVTDEELQAIVKAIGVNSGAWYQCPNGHPYAIGECGGAMQVAHCAECRVEIGGSNHRLLASNAHAGFIDRSRHAAWSEAANLANYDLERLQL